MVIDVCICTYRRPLLLREALRSLAAQVLPANVSLRVIIADNDEVPSAQAAVQQLADALSLKCHYVHAPARNISIARNACLDAVTAEIGVFMDDDEVADPGWLGTLLAWFAAHDAAVVFGPVRAAYPANAPRWAPVADLHSLRPVVRHGGYIDTGYTSNVMFDRAAVGELRFDPALGRSGGEDTQFFGALYERGVRMDFCPDAFVTEDVAKERFAMGWLLPRAFRSGQAHGRLLAARSARRGLPVAVATSKALYCALGAGLRIGSAAGWRRYLVRATLHVGVAARLLGMREITLY